MSVQKLAHLAFIIFIAGIVVSTKKTQVTQLSKSGYQIQLGNKVAILRSIDLKLGPTYRAICGNITLKQSPVPGSPHTGTSGQVDRQFSLFPEKHFHTDGLNTKVAIHTNGLSDVYVLIGTGSNETGWFLTMMELPFMSIIWFAFLLASFAGALSLYNQLKLPQLRWI